MNKKHLFSLSLTLIIVMLFSALGPTTVYADDGAPPDTTTAETPQTDGGTIDEGDTGAQTEEVATVEPQADEAVATEEAATEDPPVDEAVATEEVATEPPADEAAATEEPSLIEQLPDNTEVVVINAEGEAEPLATQDAANAVVVSDPIWCPAGQNPTPNANGCTDSYTSFDELFAYLQTNEVDTAGTIYIQMGDYAGSETSINFNSDDFTYLDTNPLTIQGGWDTSVDYTVSGSIFTPNGNSSFDIPVAIGSSGNPWGGALTINNIIITDVGDSTALTVYSDSSVMVEDSEFKSNDVNADDLYNKDGVYIEAAGDVTVKNTKVSNNGSDDWNVVNGKGLEIRSGGFVTLSSVIADDNQLFGADIQPIEGGAITGVSITNSTFNRNMMDTSPTADPPNTYLGYGLRVLAPGALITIGVSGDALFGAQANGNFLYGAWLEGQTVTIEHSTFNMNKSDSNLYVDDTGLVVVSTGDVQLDDVQANDNRMIGADIQANGQVSISNSSFSRNYGVTTDTSGVETYWGCGLQVGGIQPGVQPGDIQNCDPQTISASYITLSSVVANNNYLFGADLFSSGDVSIATSNNGLRTSFSNVTYNDGINDNFPQEQLEGLIIRSIGSDGFVTISDITANNNQTFGAEISAVGNISIADSIFSNNQNGNGLSATSSEGFIALTNVEALGNDPSPFATIPGDGAYVDAVCVYLNSGAFTGNAGYGLNAPKGKVDVNATGTFSFAGNNLGDTNLGPFNTNPFDACDNGGVIINTSPTPFKITSLSQNQLPGALGQSNTFVSAMQVSGQVKSGITLSFPIPAGMENSTFAVMFWDGSQWAEVPGGSVVNGEFVITVTQPGIYVLVVQFT